MVAMAGATVEWIGLDTLRATAAAAEKAFPGELSTATEQALSLVRGEAIHILSSYGLQRMAGATTSNVRAGPGVVTGTLDVAHPGFWVERGRRPGRMPPIEAIRGWAQQRGLVPFLVARAIGRRGIRPRPFLAPAFAKQRRAIDALFVKASASVLAQIKGA